MEINLDNNPPPGGMYGVWCEPKGHMHDPRWLSAEPSTYEAAVLLADRMNRLNNKWNYSAKWISDS
jgi:hypothetical protein